MILNVDIPELSSTLSQNRSMSSLHQISVCTTVNHFAQTFTHFSLSLIANFCRFEKIFWLDFGCGLRWRRRQSVPATAKQYFRLNKQNVRCHNLAGWW